MKVHIFILFVLVLIADLSSQQDATPASTDGSTSKPVTVLPLTGTPQGTAKSTTKDAEDNSSKPASVTTAKPTSNTLDSGTTNKTVSNKTAVTDAPTSGKNESKTTTASLTSGKKETGTVAPTTTQVKNDSGTVAPTTTTEKNNNGTVAPTTTTEKNNNGTVAPTTTTEKNNNGTIASTTTTEKNNNGTVSPTTTTEKNNNGTVAPTMTTEKNNNGTIAPTTTTEKNNNGTVAPTTTTEKNNNGTIAPTTTTEKNNNGTVAPTTTTEKNNNGTVAPTTTTEKNNNGTVAPTTTEKKDNGTIAPTTTEKKDIVTDAPQTTNKVTDVTSQTMPVSEEIIYINEILVDKNGAFQKIELHLSKQFNVSKYAMVIVDGESKSYMAVVNLTDMIQQDDFLLFDFTQTTLSPMLKDKGTGIAVYNTTQITMSDSWSSDVPGVMDALVIGKDYDKISNDLTQALTPGVNPFVLDPNMYGQSRAISRCSSEQMRSTDMFALINPSYGVDNDVKCQERFTKYKKMSIKISGIDCKLLNNIDLSVSSEQLTLREVLRYVTNQVNKQCLCGLTLMHVVKSDTKVTCCDGASIEMRFVASSEEHLQKLSDSYKMFLKNTQTVTIGDKDYTLDSKCEGRCCDAHHIGPKKTTDDDKANKVKVTVAVIITCLVVFSIVVVIVIIYMRKKNRAVYQFRMSRLDEEDDLYNDGPDHDDFIGGQEATFDIKRR
ncbi:hypothetical protein ACF0H5_003814 [Mactra antiquata]